jgi:para-aminobenzoate synthetase/4-amino-4-deoxychorismate lyase
LGSGGGIVADSQPEDEWQECMIKKSFTSYFKNDFEIIETLLWEKAKGFSDIEEHLARAMNTASLFCFKWDMHEIKKNLARLEEELSSLHKLARVRLLFSKDGNIKTEYSPLAFKGWGKELADIKVSKHATSSLNIFLRHKTTIRELYNTEYKNALSEGFDEVIFLNEKSEMTEGAITNIFVRKNGKYYTPPLSGGLLNGIWRKQQIKLLNAAETIISLNDLSNAEEVIIGNSVRGGIKAVLK